MVGEGAKSRWILSRLLRSRSSFSDARVMVWTFRQSPEGPAAQCRSLQRDLGHFDRESARLPAGL